MNVSYLRVVHRGIFFSSVRSGRVCPLETPGSQLHYMYFVLVIGHLAHAVEKDLCIM
jgi:hypothetical protein